MLQLTAAMRFFGEVAEEHDEPSGIDLLLPASSELIAGLIAFGIIFVFVWKWVLPMVDKRLEARQAAIIGQLTAAENTKHEAESLLADYKQQLAMARDEANKIVEEARKSADALRTDMVGKAETEAQLIVRKARESAASERERAAASIRDEVASLSLDLARRVVSDSVDASVQKKLVDRYIAELEELKA
ncbi:MAG: F0F1 ATP synthase subunit B [Acidimicrobiia bacterium]